MILYIDTSSNFLYTGIVEKDKIICEIKKEYGHTLSEYALPEIVSMFEKNNIEPNQLTKIVVVDGPGSFTGIRIGITIAKVYAWSLNIPITTITSLEAMMLSNKDNKIKVPIIDARRGFVFAAIYNSDNQEILSPQHIKLTDLMKKLENKDYIFITNDEIEQIDNKVTYSPDIKKITNYVKDKSNINPHLVNPNYLKLTEAE